MIIWRTSVMAFLAGITAFACAAPVADLEQARRAVAEADRAWAAAAEARDVEASVSAMAEDGVMYPPDQAPVVGRAAIKSYMSTAFATPGFAIQWTTGEIRVASGGDLAYSVGRSRYTVPDSEGALRTIHAKGIAIWRHEPDGAWRCVADIWNGTPE